MEVQNLEEIQNLLFSIDSDDQKQHLNLNKLEEIKNRILQEFGALRACFATIHVPCILPFSFKCPIGAYIFNLLWIPLKCLDILSDSDQKQIDLAITVNAMARKYIEKTPYFWPLSSNVQISVNFIYSLYFTIFEFSLKPLINQSRLLSLLNYQLLALLPVDMILMSRITMFSKSRGAKFYTN